MAETITKMKCEKCGESASGPDEKDVKAAMARHAAKAHKAPAKKAVKE